jgi:gliding motility-associated-like protein
LIVSDANGCLANDTVAIKEILCCEKLFVPNAFSPNGDLKNDELNILNIVGVEILNFKIANRFGNIVHSTNKYSWDGTYLGVKCDVGVYYYFIQYKCLADNKDYLLKGYIELIR